MTNYNERLDKILLDNLQKMSEDVQAFGILDCKNYLPEYKQALTSLIKELVAEAKPEYISPDQPLGLKYQGRNEAIQEFEQNLLKALEEE